MVLKKPQRAWERYPFLLLAIFLIFFFGCATTKVPTDLALTPLRNRDQSIAVGQFSNNTGFRNPNQIRFNVSLDSPVSELVRHIVISELKRDGFTIGDSSYEVNGTITSIVYGPHGTSISFNLRQILGGKVVYEKTVVKGSGTLHIYNSLGQLDQVRECARDFVVDLSRKIAQFETNQ